MSPFYGFFERMVAGLLVIGLLVGVVGGAVTWFTRARVLFGLVGAVAVFAVAVLLEENLKVLLGLGGLGVPPLLFGVLVSHLAARLLEARTTWPRIVAALAAFALALCAGLLVMLLIRWNLWAPLVVAAIADVALVVVAVRTRTRGGAR